MKVSASPFEAPVGASRSGAKREASVHLVGSATAPQSVRAGLDSATKEALKQLADLIKEKAEQESDQSQEDSAPGGHSQKEDESLSSHENESSKARGLLKKMEPLEPSLLQTEKKAMAAVVRMQDYFESVRKQRGREVYRQILRDQALAQIEDQFQRGLTKESADGGLDGAMDEALDVILEIGADLIDSALIDSGIDARPEESDPASLKSRTRLKRVA